MDFISFRSGEITHQLTESEKHGPNGTESKAEASTGRNHLSPIESVTASANESPGGVVWNEKQPGVWG